MPVQFPNSVSPYTTGTSTGTGPGNNTRTGSALGAAYGLGDKNSKDSDDKTPSGDKNTTDASGTDSADGTGNVIDAIYGDESDKMVSMEDFLTLMVAQLKNQDFMNPVDDTQYVTQLAQISTMQQMEAMAYNAKSTYVTSLVGKYVSAAKFTVSGELKKTDGIVDKVSLLDEKFVIYVDGEAYDMDEIMEIKTAPVTAPPEDNENDGDGGDENSGDGDSKSV